jgi:choline transport protein
MKYERKRAQRRDIAIVFIIVMLFCLRHLDVVLSTPTNMPITALIYQTTGSRAAGVILTVMLGVVSSTAQMAVTSASRLLYATARDKGMPFLTWYVEFPRLPADIPNSFSEIRPGLNVPARSILACFVFNVCFGLLYLGLSVAFYAYVASCTIFLNIS